MFVHPRLGLNGRSIALCVLLLLGTVSALGTALIWQNYHDSLRRKTEHAVIYAQSVSHSAEPAVLLNDRSALDHVVRAAGQDSTVERASILGADGRLLALLQQQPNFVPELEVDPRLPMGEPPTHGSAHIQRTTNQMLVVVPIWHASDPIDLGLFSEESVKPETTDTPLGYICLTYSLGHIQSELNQRMFSSATVAVLVICAGIGATLVSMRQLLRPLQNLVETTAAIAEGDRTKRARENAVGEIGALARAFNHMAGRLQESYASIEQKVVERTTELEARKRELEREIAERERVQEQIARQSTLLEAINAVFQETLTCQSKEEVAQVCLSKAQSLTDSAFGFLGEINQDGCFDTIALSAPAWDTCTIPRSNATAMLKDMPLRGIWSTVIAEQRSQIINDPMTHPKRVGTPEGHPPVIRFLGVPLKDAGKVIGLIGLANRESEYEATHIEHMETLAAAFMEATNRKLAEEQLREHATLLTSKNAELERQQLQLQTRERELIITNEALEEAKVAAEAASRTKSDFLANMSHEIRTPLTAILGFADNLQDSRLSAEEKIEAVATIRRNGNHLVQIINDILDISKIEAGKLQTEELACSIVQIITDIESLMGARALAKGLAFKIEYCGPIPETIHTDPTRLRQILVNLVGNAIKFTQQGSVRLVTRFIEDSGIQGFKDSSEPPSATLESSNPRPLGSFLQFDVIDTGIGLNPEQIKKVFKPFVQADETMTRNFGGTGLGLAISRRLAKMLGGDIAVDSTLDKGSTFSVTIATGALDGIPMLEHPSKATTVHPDPPASVKSTERKLDCRILLAEDGPDNQRLISFLLRKAGAHVEVAENGKIAVDLALETRQVDNPFDVILMDMQMPVMDGYCATTLLRQEGYTHPIIALTAHAMAQDRDKCLNAGCDEYATKPINRQALIELIQRYVTAGTSAASPT